MAAKAKTKVDKSPKIPQKDKYLYELNIRERDDLTEKQQQFLALLTDKHTRVVFCKGPAGTSKTYLAVQAALRLINSKTVSDLIYVRSLAESASKSIGSLPGELEEKFGPFTMPLMDKLEEFLTKGDIDRLQKEDRIQATPINFLRGASFNVKYILLDEAQNFTFEELVTAITRIGEFSKVVIIGDVKQSDVGYRSGFNEMFQLFNTPAHKEAGIHTFEFGQEDIVRSGILRLIVQTLEEHTEKKTQLKK